MDKKLLIALIIIIALVIICLWLATGHCRKPGETIDNEDVTMVPATMTLMPVPGGPSKENNTGLKAYAKSETLPVFLRKGGRKVATATRRKVGDFVALPVAFDAREKWSGMMAPVQDQGECGSCWSFSACAAFGDRIKVASNGKDLAPKDIISPYALAACLKCKNNGVPCYAVCDGHYMDEVMDHFLNKGAYSIDTINRFANYGTQYICYKPKPDQNAKLLKSKRSYRVNPYTVGELRNADRLELNEKQIMYDIFKYGPVTCTIKVFDPLKREELHKNFYLYKDGVYGYPWQGGDPSIYDGYHALCIIGWGTERVGNKDVKYWILRNSWGTEWGMNGYGKIVRGENRAIVESDIWAPRY